MATQHETVLKSEVLEWLNPRPDQVFVDGTLGGGGHTELLAQAVGPTGSVIALDRDPAALDGARQRLADLPVTFVASDFRDLPEVLADLGIPLVDGAVLDLGMSSDQLADESRGFSFDSVGPLDLRFDPQRGDPAWRLLERLSERHLADLIYTYGEERLSRRIARNVVSSRRHTPIRTSQDLARLVLGCTPRSAGRRRIHPATRTFQALRIAVNDELGALESALKRYPSILRTGARLAIISFHSLEDRRVKQAFRDDPRYTALTRKPIRPNEQEILRNPRSRSARLRIGEICAVQEGCGE
jgi:16S rRNA (cytosine1402-N4)-methyltransferase